MKQISSSLSREHEASTPLPRPTAHSGASAGVRIVLLRKIPEESALRQRWNDLVFKMESPEVFYTWEWALAVQAAYHASQKPLLLLGYDGEDLIGVASLCTDLSGQSVSFLAGTTGDYCDFLSHSERRAEFVHSVFAELRRMGIRNLVFANLPADSPTLEALRSAAKEFGFHLHLRPAYSCPRVDLGSGVQRHELKTSIAGKRQLRRCLKAMGREGPVTMTYLRTWEQIRAALPDFVDKHVARFRAKQGTSFLFTPERQLFMEDLARRSCQTGNMVLSVLKIADRPVAWSYGFHFNGEWFLYQTTFDIRCEDNSPGYCLLGRILIEACDMDHLQVVDLGLGAEAYKEWFSNSARQTLHAMLTTSTLHYMREVARYRLATEVKKFPKLEGAIRTVRSGLRL